MHPLLSAATFISHKWLSSYHRYNMCVTRTCISSHSPLNSLNSHTPLPPSVLTLSALTFLGCWPFQCKKRPWPTIKSFPMEMSPSFQEIQKYFTESQSSILGEVTTAIGSSLTCQVEKKLETLKGIGKTLFLTKKYRKCLLGLLFPVLHLTPTPLAMVVIVFPSAPMTISYAL